MLAKKKAFALISGVVIALSATGIAQQQNVPPGGETLVIDENVTIHWIEKSQVSALREGVIKSMELQIGKPVKKGAPIGYLHDDVARLTLKKANLMANAKAPLKQAEAKERLAIEVVAVNQRLNARTPGLVSAEEMRKAEAEVNVAAAMVLEAQEKTEIEKAERDLAAQAHLEHTIVAPFEGVIIERMKNPGESVRANEPVVELGNLDRLRAETFVQIDYALRVKEGMRVEFQPRITGNRTGIQPIEKRKFVGKLTFVDPQIQAIAETAVRIYAEFDNKDHALQPGMKGVLVIYLNDVVPPDAPAPAVGARSDIPPLPR